MRTRTDPSTRARAVVPNDSTNLPDGASRALYVGATGDVEVIMQGDTAAVVFKAVAVGEHPWSVKRVLDANTTATDIVALY